MLYPLVSLQTPPLTFMFLYIVIFNSLECLTSACVCMHIHVVYIVTPPSNIIDRFLKFNRQFTFHYTYMNVYFSEGTCEPIYMLLRYLSESVCAI